MAYTRRYVGGFVNGDNSRQVDDVFLNAVETALLKLQAVDPTADGQVMQWDLANTRFGPALLLNKNIDPAAAIDKSKLNLTGQIVDADIAGAAAIAKSKLSLTGQIINADINAAAAIALSKLAALTAHDATLSIGAANTDITWAWGLTPSVVASINVTGTTGTVRSIGGATQIGQRLILRSGGAAGTLLTIKNSLAGGTGAQILTRNSADILLGTSETVELEWQGTFWFEVSRDNGSAAEIAYSQITANVTISGAAGAPTDLGLSLGAVTYDGSPIYIEAFTSAIATAAVASSFIVVRLYDGATYLCDIATLQAVGASAVEVPVYVKIKVTPSAGSHTYKLMAYQSGGNGTLLANTGTGGAAAAPAFIRASKV